MSDNVYVWIRVKLGTLWSAIRALKRVAHETRDASRLEESSQEQYRKRGEADVMDANANELRDAAMRGQLAPPADPKDGNGEHK